MTRESLASRRQDPTTGAAAAAFVQQCVDRWRAAPDEARRPARRRLRRAWRALRPTLEAYSAHQIARHNLHPSSTALRLLEWRLPDGVDRSPRPPDAHEERRWLQRATRGRPRRLPDGPWSVRWAGVVDGVMADAGVVLSVDGPAGRRSVWAWSAGTVHGPTHHRDAEVHVERHAVTVRSAVGTLHVTGQVCVELDAVDDALPIELPMTRAHQRRAAMALAHRCDALETDPITPMWDREADGLALALALLTDPEDRGGELTDLWEALAGLGDPVEAVSDAMPKAVPLLPAVQAMARELARWGAVTAGLCAAALDADPALPVHRDVARRRGLAARVAFVNTRLRWDYELDGDGARPRGRAVTLRGTSGHYDDGILLTLAEPSDIHLVNSFSHPAVTASFEEASGAFTLHLASDSGSSSERPLRVTADTLYVQDSYADPYQASPSPLDLPEGLRVAARALRELPPALQLPEPSPWRTPLPRGVVTTRLGDPVWRGLLAAIGARAPAGGTTLARALDALRADAAAALASHGAEQTLPLRLDDDTIARAILDSLGSARPFLTGDARLDTLRRQEVLALAPHPDAARRAAATLLRFAAAEVPAAAARWLRDAEALQPPPPSEAEVAEARALAAKAVMRHLLGLAQAPLHLPPPGPGAMLHDPHADARRSPEERLVEAAALATRRPIHGLAPSELLPDPTVKARAQQAADQLRPHTDRVERLTEALSTWTDLSAPEIELYMSGDGHAATRLRLMQVALRGHPVLRP